MKLKRFIADLHIHTALSPCASEDMTPDSIVKEALKAGINMIAICDHNSAKNTIAVQKIAKSELTVIAGIEITTQEEVHVLGLFPSSSAACSASEEVLSTLPLSGKHIINEKNQPIFDEYNRVIGYENRMLIDSSAYSLFDAVELIRRYRGIAIAAHVDRPSFSVPGQLGIFPPDVSFDGIEISASGVQYGREKMFLSMGIPMICSSDSHFLSDIGTGRTVLLIEKPTFQELTLALKGVGGRKLSFA